MLFWYFLKTRFYAAYGQWVQVLILIIQVLKLLVQVFQTDESCDRPFESLDYPPSFVKDPTSVSEGKELCSSYSLGGEYTGVDVTGEVQIPDFLRCRRGPEESPSLSQALSKLFWIFGDSLSFTKVEARRRLHSSQPLVQQAHYKTVEIPSKVAFEKNTLKKSF